MAGTIRQTQIGWLLHLATVYKPTDQRPADRVFADGVTVLRVPMGWFVVETTVPKWHEKTTEELDEAKFAPNVWTLTDYAPMAQDPRPVQCRRPGTDGAWGNHGTNVKSAVETLFDAHARWEF